MGCPRVVRLDSRGRGGELGGSTSSREVDPAVSRCGLIGQDRGAENDFGEERAADEDA